MSAHRLGRVMSLARHSHAAVPQQALQKRLIAIASHCAPSSPQPLSLSTMGSRSQLAGSVAAFGLFEGVKSRSFATTAAAAGDPHDIHSRFIVTHQDSFTTALREIHAGKKRSHWSWWIFPTPPYKYGSPTNKHFALHNDDQARAFLAFPETNGVNLRRNYIEIMSAVAEACELGITLRELVGDLDDPKVRSSCAFFLRIAKEDKDEELIKVLQRLEKAIS